jgi:hypothetical protein
MTVPEDKQTQVQPLQQAFAWLTDIIDQRIAMTVRQEVAAIINSDEFGDKLVRIIRAQGATTHDVAAAVTQAINGIEFAAKVEGLVSQDVQAKMGNTRKAIHEALEEMHIDDQIETAVDSWMDDSNNVRRLSERIDLDDAISETLRDGSFTVEFRP